MTITYVSACLSMAYDCPCCDAIVMSGDDGARALCGDCQSADCTPNRDGAYDDCKRPCASCGDPRSADFYVCVVYARSDDETDYSDGYLCADHVPDKSDVPGVLIPTDATVLEYTVSELPR